MESTNAMKRAKEAMNQGQQEYEALKTKLKKFETKDNEIRNQVKELS